MAAGDTVRIGPNAIYKGDDRYAPGSEVPASRFTKAELEMFAADGSLTVHAAKPQKATAPKESGGRKTVAEMEVTVTKEDDK